MSAEVQCTPKQYKVQHYNYALQFAACAVHKVELAECYCTAKEEVFMQHCVAVTKH